MQIIDDIIDISKIEINQMSLNIQEVNIYDSMHEVVEVNENKIDTLNKNIVIEFSVEEEIKELLLKTDKIRFKQILQNLIGNAVKYTTAGKIETGYSLKKEEKRTVAEFFVKDTGRGIPKDEQKMIFDRFSQAGNVSFQEGTGLGLSITKGLLQLLGGKIWLESELGKGSSFYFTLPIANEQNQQLAKKKLTATNAVQPELAGKKVIIAEDDENSYLYITEILKTADVKFRRVTNGRELLIMLEKEIPDLVLLDINMPVMNGYEAMKIIQETYPELPVVAQTAYAMENERKKCFEYGCCGYIAKPFKMKELFEIIKMALSK